MRLWWEDDFKEVSLHFTSAAGWKASEEIRGSRSCGSTAAYTVRYLDLISGHWVWTWCYLTCEHSTQRTTEWLFHKVCHALNKRNPCETQVLKSKPSHTPLHPPAGILNAGSDSGRGGGEWREGEAEFNCELSCQGRVAARSSKNPAAFRGSVHLTDTGIFQYLLIHPRWSDC